jgi:hypothetical protein
LYFALILDETAPTTSNSFATKDEDMFLKHSGITWSKASIWGNSLSSFDTGGAQPPSSAKENNAEIIQQLLNAWRLKDLWTREDNEDREPERESLEHLTHWNHKHTRGALHRGVILKWHNAPPPWHSPLHLCHTERSKSKLSRARTNSEPNWTDDINVILHNFMDYYGKLYEHKKVCPLALDRLIKNLRRRRPRWGRKSRQRKSSKPSWPHRATIPQARTDPIRVLQGEPK